MRTKATLFLWALSLTLLACGSDAPQEGPSGPGGPSGPACAPVSSTETNCSDGVDDDCDGRKDCLDTDCEAKACGGGALTCLAGGCVQSGVLPALPPVGGLNAVIRGDTAIVSFFPIDGARDYRIYAFPKEEDVLVGMNGELVIKNAIYHCGGDRQFNEYKTSGPGPYTPYTNSVAGITPGYDNRTEAESLFGYVFTTPAAGRQPVYRLANTSMVRYPGTPPYFDNDTPDYVVGEAARDALLAKGYRNDGLAFYAPDQGSGTKPVTRIQYAPSFDRRSTLFYTDGPEAQAREKDSGRQVEDKGVRFNVLGAQADGALPLYRVFLEGGDNHDVLAVGAAGRDRSLKQGNQPVWTVTWPGLTAKTTLVLEALDQGCPFPGGFLGHMHATDSDNMIPIMTLDEAHLSSGELYVNGQFEPTNRPKPIARAFIDVEPQAPPMMDWFEGFKVTDTFEPFNVQEEGNGFFYYRNSKWIADFTWCSNRHSLGTMFGQLVSHQGDIGAGCHLRITPRNVPTTLAADSYLHATMTVELPSTGRRYPQLMFTTVPQQELTAKSEPNMTPVQERLADGSSILVQPFGIAFDPVELQIEFCDHFKWNVNAQCPKADIYRFKKNDTDPPQLPVPVLSEVAGFDWPVKLDVYASTSRVYVFVDDKPGGCAVLPAGKMPAGAVTAIFGSVIYHSGADEWALPDMSPQQFLHRYSLTNTSHHFDNLGLSNGVPAPTWDEKALPCATKFIEP